MKKFYYILPIIILTAVAAIWLMPKQDGTTNTGQVENSTQNNDSTETQNSQENNQQNSNTDANTNETPKPETSTDDRLKNPISRAKERVTKKPFGLLVSPNNSPVSPEKFSGYHTGVDFEVFPEEQDSDVQITAVCTGQVKQKSMASGYGGVIVQACTIGNSPVTIIYGHLKLSSITKNIGDQLNSGETIGVLGTGFSSETSGERKHLHLGIHKGTAISILGYVQKQSDLSQWIDITKYMD